MEIFRKSEFMILSTPIGMEISMVDSRPMDIYSDCLEMKYSDCLEVQLVG